ncbi:WAT1-related protein At1g68170-like [Euphorbia lathyris]|uniref:WAT1-related protein At1g68170-like n=1 Tax=Euphorbia lathyris TaxID=212925 RepID=UPI003314373C
MTVKKILKWLEEVKAVLLMIVVQFCFADVNVFYKLAMNDAMNMQILVAYRFIFASLFLISLAFLFERKKRPKLTKTILFQAFLCGIFGGTLNQNTYAESLEYTSVTFATAMVNLIPAVTFILAISFGLEKLRIRRAEGKAKVVGTIMGIGGAMVLTFYKGEEIKIWSTHFNLMKVVKLPHELSRKASSEKIGLIYSIANCLCFSVWLIIQGKMSEKYPYPYSASALMSTMAAFQSTVFALCFHSDLSHWKLGWNIRLFTTAYAGIVVQGMMITVMIWCVSIKGPLFATCFYPLMLLFAAIEGSLLLDEQLHLGSIIGATLIVLGLFAVLWGKNKEIKMSQLPIISTTTQQEDDSNNENKAEEKV